MTVEERERVLQRLEFAAQVEFFNAPTYQRVIREVAGDEWLLTLFDLMPPEQHQPLLLMAAARFVGLQVGVDPFADFAGFAGFCRAHESALRPLLATRAVQTNEVGRSSLLRPALVAVEEEAGTPLALVDVGCSAGLNLHLDHYAIDYGDGLRAGPPGAEVSLRAATFGAPPPTGPLELAWCVGIDAAPIDVHDEEEIAWLRACVWADFPEREHQLMTGVEHARSHSVRLVAADAGDGLRSLMKEIPRDLTVVVVSTMVLMYVRGSGRDGFMEAMATAGRPAWWVTLEAPGVIRGVDAPPLAADALERGSLPSVLAVTRFEGGVGPGRALAWAGAWGDWIEWLGG